MPTHHHTLWIRRLAVSLTAAISLATIGSAVADVFSDYESSVHRFEEKLRNGEDLPRFNDKNSAPLIRQLTDPKVIKRIDFNNDLVALRAMEGPCQYSGYMTLVYLGHGVNFSNTDQANMQESVNRNGLRYQDEVSAIQSFSISCMSHVMPMMTRYLQTSSPEPSEMSEEQRKGIAGLRGNIIQSMTGMLTAVEDPNVTPANRAKLLQSLTTATPNLASLLPMASRRDLTSIVNSTRAHIPTAHQHYADQINLALVKAPCKKACQMVITP